MNIKVEIISPTEAKELNPLGSVNGCINVFVTYAMWQEAEQKRRVFKIVNSGELFQFGFDTTEGLYVEYDSIHIAEIDSENLNCVIK